MSKGQTPSLNAFRKQVHRALRNWKGSRRIPSSLFSDLHLFRHIHNDRSLSSIRRQARLYQELEICISELGIKNEKYGDVLIRRFAKSESIRKIAYALHLSIDQLNRNQREAISALTGLLLEKEVATRRETKSLLAECLLPSNYSQLVGREKLIARCFKILQSKSSPWLIALTGIGGTGKTAVADAAVRQTIKGSEFTDVLWIRFERETTMNWETLLGKLATKVLPTDTPSATFEQEIRRKLKSSSHLLVLDNVGDEIENLDWLQHLLQFCDPSKVLITSRWKPADLAEIYQIKVPELDQASAQKLLLLQLGELGLEEHISTVATSFDQIFARTGGSPLALKLVAGLLHIWPLDLILRSISETPTGRTQKMFAQIYQDAWNSLEPGGRAVLQSMQLVGPEGASLDRLAEITHFRQTNLANHLGELTKRSLLEFRGGPGNPRYRIQRLTCSFLSAGVSNRWGKGVQASPLINVRQNYGSELEKQNKL